MAFMRAVESNVNIGEEEDIGDHYGVYEGFHLLRSSSTNHLGEISGVIASENFPCARILFWDILFTLNAGYLK